jgi:hypothetical protein
LTASQDLKVTCANFPLDGADDFIDECNDLGYNDYGPESVRNGAATSRNVW